MADPFEVIESIGSGGMGHVWRARDTATGEELAVKVIHSHLVNEPQFVSRFLREAQLASRLNSPHIVRVLGQGTINGAPYLAMELVQGSTLRQLIKQRGTLPGSEAMPLARQLVAGLAAIHAAGIVHRDIKPSNLMLTAGGTLKIADFGIASAFDVTRITQTDQTLGTPHYTAPEGQRDERSDLYSVGCVIFEMLAGAPPFDGTSQQDVIRKHLSEPVDFSRVPEEFQPLLRWLLDKRAERRPHSAAQLLAVLDGAETVPLQRTRACPFCESEISLEAKKCRYCGEWVGEGPQERPDVPPPLAGKGPALAPETETRPARTHARARPSPAQRPADASSLWRSPAIWLVVAGGIIGIAGFFLVPGNTDGDPDYTVRELISEARNHPQFDGLRGDAVDAALLWWLIPITSAAIVVAGLFAALGYGRESRGREHGLAAAGVAVIAANALALAGIAYAFPDDEQPYLMLWLTGLWNSAPSFPVMTLGGLLVIAGAYLARRERIRADNDRSGAEAAVRAH